MNIIEIKDRDRTAWYRSDKVTNIAKAAELLNRAIDAEKNPDITTVEKVGGKALIPLTCQEYENALRGLTNGPDHGFVAEVDLENDSGSFTNIDEGKEDIISVYAAISQLAGLYQMSIERETGNLDTRRFVERVLNCCNCISYCNPEERFGTQIQEPGQALI